MKKLVNKFFGIGIEVRHGYSGAPYSYYGRKPGFGWCTLCRFIRGLCRMSDAITIALMVLKLIGSIESSWFVVFLPIIISAVFDTIETIVDNWVNSVNDRLREEYYAKLAREETKHKEDEYEEEYDEVYHLK